MLHRLVRLHSCMGDQGETYGETELGYRVEPNSLKGQRFLRPLFFSFFFCAGGTHWGYQWAKRRMAGGGRKHSGYSGLSGGVKIGIQVAILGSHRLGIWVQRTMAKMAYSESPKWHGCRNRKIISGVLLALELPLDSTHEGSWSRWAKW